MRHKTLAIIVIISISSSVLFACKGKSEGPVSKYGGQSNSAPVARSPVAEDVIKPKEEMPKYSYRSGSRRDPFVPLVGRSDIISMGASTDTSKAQVNMGMLALKGLIWDQAKPVVLFKASDGTSYVVSKQRLVDDRGRIVEGIAAVVKEDKVILIGKDNNIKEFKFSKLREESE
ncbi:MAG: hypothetical protein ABH868_07555 [bacterium]